MNPVVLFDLQGRTLFRVPQRSIDWRSPEEEPVFLREKIKKMQEEHSKVRVHAGAKFRSEGSFLFEGFEEKLEGNHTCFSGWSQAEPNLRCLG